MDDVDDVWTVTRSMLDPRVWVSYNHEGDESCFLHAGGLKAVKAWVERQEDMTVHRWIKGAPNNWYLVERGPVT